MIGAFVLWVAVQAPATAPARPTLDERQIQRLLTHTDLGPPPADPTNRFARDPRAAELGQALFFDARLSKDAARSCASCHDPERGFADGTSLSRGLAQSTRHSPTLWNAAYQRWFFWDGHADSLWSQALKPIESPLEMGGDRRDVAALLASDPALRSRYEPVFGSLPDQVTPETIDEVFANVGKALAAYQTLLVSRDSAFDRFASAVRAKDHAAVASYPDEALRGLVLFLGRGNCRTCHAGPNFSDDEFHDIGIPPLGGGPPHDPGRRAGIERVQADPFNAAGRFSDDRDGARAKELAQLAPTAETWGQFKTPTLRNVARTAPYMHQGQVATLRDVVRYYSTLEGALSAGHHGETVLVPLKLTDREIDDLVAFLGTLTDESIPEVLRKPLGTASR